jgi:hypothetical protein
MRHKMTKDARLELSKVVRQQYKNADWSEKGALLDHFVATTGYSRKYAVKLLNEQVCKHRKFRKKRASKYGDSALAALKKVWLASNRLCSKRLVPFLPELIASMRKFGHLDLDEDTEKQLLSLSAATMDRMLKPERKKYGPSKSTTKPGQLLKSQIEVRTFGAWDNAEPGFLEADCVAHCGPIAKGPFLYTLTVTDIATGWTELFGLPNKGESAVAAALSQSVRLLPFPVQGLDTDNGSEFINNVVISWCSRRKVTFTRSREYKKNDQAHVEEKNGSIVRRYVGYQRFEGEDSLCNLLALYRQVRLYVNYFQPSMKLSAKERLGGRVTKRYERAATPAQRILQSKLSDEVKSKVREQYSLLDPVALLKDIQHLQHELWKTACQADPKMIAEYSLVKVLSEADSKQPETVLVKLDQHSKELRRMRRRVPREPVLIRIPQGSNISACLKQQIEALPPGAHFAVRQIENFGSRGALDNALFRLHEERKIARIAHGKYAVM